MEMRDKDLQEIKGAESILIHNGNIVLGMQDKKRWYKLENGQTAAIIKTIGGKIEAQDENNSKNALIREVLEEIKEIQKREIVISNTPIFTKKIKMSELNPYELNSELKMNADFYFIEILNKKRIFPNDLPALLEIPIDKFLKLELAKKGELKNLKDFIIKNNDMDFDLPECYAFMIPTEVKSYLEKIRGDEQR